MFKKGFLFLFLISFIICLPSTANALSVEDYAPVFYFESEENCFPVDVSYHIDNSYMKALGESYSGISLKASNLNFNLLSTFFSEDDIQYTYLDNEIGSVNDTKIIDDYQSKLNNLGYTVYYRVFDDNNAKIVQYWMFYAFNDGTLNKHEGDWEMVQVVIPKDGSEKWVGYSQHHSGQKADWNQVEKEGSSIKVYVARGSHANYLRYFSGKLGIGMGSDYVGSSGRILKYGDYNLVKLDNQSWLDYSGHWGEINSVEDIALGRAGPFGPKFRQSGNMWDNPESWGNSLISSSDTFFTADWFIYHFIHLFILFAGIALVITIFKIYRRYKKQGLGPRILSMLYIDGLNLKSIGNIICFVGIFIAILGLFYSWYSVSADIDIEGYGTGGVMKLISLDGINGFRISLPGTGGAIPIGALLIPFSVIIGIGIVFLFISTIGISKSKKLGKKYIWRGLKIFLPIVILLVVIMSIGYLIPQSFSMQGSTESSNYIIEMLGSISSSPMGGEKEIILPVSEDVSGYVGVTWGLGLGAYLLVFGGIIMLIAGIIEVIADKDLFQPKESSKKLDKSKIKNPVKTFGSMKKEQDKKQEEENNWE